MQRPAEKKPTVLISTGYYLPGYEAGGPIRSTANFVAALSDEFDFLVLTPDRDLNAEKAYDAVTPGTWQRFGEAQVLYLAPDALNWRTFKQLLSATAYDVIYLNSFFHPRFTLTPLLLQRLAAERASTIVAPRGELSSGAVKLKGFKKLPFLYAARLLSLYKGVLWHATTADEANAIRAWFGATADIALAPNISRPTVTKMKAKVKTAGRLKAVFLSRIARGKNLLFALNRLTPLKGEVEFSLYGPVEDAAYWRECQAAIQALPGNVRVVYKGSVPHDRVTESLEAHHLFFFPTLSENFGHVILEAFAAGLPVLVSDQTPWRNLSKAKAGWDIPLTEPGRFSERLQMLIDMDQAHFEEHARAALEYGLKHLQSDTTGEHRQMFRRALADR